MCVFYAIQKKREKKGENNDYWLSLNLFSNTPDQFREVYRRTVDVLLITLSLASSFSLFLLFVVVSHFVQKKKEIVLKW